MGIGVEGTTLTPLSACTETCGLCSNAGQLWVAVGRVQAEECQAQDAHRTVATLGRPHCAAHDEMAEGTCQSFPPCQALHKVLESYPAAYVHSGE